MADEGKLPLKDLQEQFKDIYDEEIEEEQLKTDLNDLVELTEEEVQSITYQWSNKIEFCFFNFWIEIDELVLFFLSNWWIDTV